MQCSKCKEEAVIFQPYSGQHLCREHLRRDIESRVKKTIRRHHWMRPEDHIAVAMTGAAADHALLLFFRNLAGKRRDVTVSEIQAGRISDIVAVAHGRGITRIALSTTLETISASILTGFLRGEADLCTGASHPVPGAPPVITPFGHIPAGEIAAYARICGVGGDGPVPDQTDPLFSDVQSLLAAYSQRHPSAPHAILNLSETLNHIP